jgi:rod shape determining protein RodA
MFFLLFKKLGRINYLTLVTALIMAGCSVAFIASATFMVDNPELQNAYKSQLIYIPVGLTAFLICALVDYEFWLKLSPLFFLVVAGLLVAVLFTHKVYGARSWIRLGGVGVQPAELCKLVYILCLTLFLIWRQDRIKDLSTPFLVLGVTMVPVGLIMLQPDFGTSCVFFPIAFVMMWVAGVRRRYLILPVVLIVMVLLYCYLGVHLKLIRFDLPRSIGPKERPADLTEVSEEDWIHWKDQHTKELVLDRIPGLKAYQMNRIRVFFDPNLDPRGAGWTINQSMIAIGSGGLGGKGYKQGTQNVLGFLPRSVSYNDFIYPVVCEEWGFLGGAALILGEAIILFGCIYFAWQSASLSGALIVSGVIAMWFTHVFINIGMTMKVVPITGIPLPLISYGGTFLVVCLAGLGLAQSVWIHRTKL